MAVSSQKFLPSGKSGSLAVMPAAKLSMIRKPLIATSSDSDAKKTVFDIRNKVTSLAFIFRSKKILKKRILDRKKKVVEVENNKKREERLESKKKATNKDNEKLLITPPGGNIVDSLTRFAGFTLLGFVVNKYSSLLPKLINFGKTIQPAVEIFGSFAENIVGNSINFIERGYQAYDAVNDIVKKIGGEDYEKKFGQFSKVFNVFLQSALLTGIAGFGGGIIKKPQAYQEAIKTGKSVLSGEAGLSLKTKKNLFNNVIKNKKLIKDKRELFKQKVNRNKVRAAQQKLRLVQENDLKKSKRKERAKKVARGEITVKPRRASGEQIIGAEVKRKYPNTVREGKLMYTDPSGGYKVDFALPGQPTKRLSPEVAAGIRNMYENPKDRYTKQIAYEAFKYPDLYESDIRANYLESRKKLFKQDRMKPASKQTGILSASAAKQMSKQAAKQTTKGISRFVPVLGPLIDIVISLIAGDPLDEAVVGALGATVGGFLGTALVGAGTFGLGAVIGASIGGFLGDMFARSLYQAAKGFIFKPKAYASGGQVTRGGVTRGAVSRDIKKPNIRDIKTRKTTMNVVSQQTVVGKNASLDFKKIYGEKGLKSLIDSSRDVKKIKLMHNIWGALGGAYIDMLLGQKPDKNLAPSIGKVIGALTTERFGERSSRALLKSLEDSANNIFRHLYIAAGEERPSTSTETPSEEYTPPTNIPSSGYKPISPGNYNIIQYITGDTTQSANYKADHGGSEYHEHVAFKTKEDKERAKAALRAAGFHVGSEFRSGDPGYHGLNLAIDVPFYPNQSNLGYTDDVGGERKFSSDVRRILGIGVPVVKPSPEKPVSQSPQASIAPNQKDVKVSSRGLDGRASYELAIHERNVFLYQQETVLA